jgi:hypothetical protein
LSGLLSEHDGEGFGRGDGPLDRGETGCFALESVILALGEILRSPEDTVVVNMDEIERENEVKQETTIQPMRDMAELRADPKAEGKGKWPGNRIFGLGYRQNPSDFIPCV